MTHTNESRQAERVAPQRRLRVLMTVHHDPDPDTGTPGSTLNLARALRERGHHVELFALDRVPGWLGNRTRALVFPLLVALRVLRDARGGRVDVVDAAAGNLWATPRRVTRQLALVTRSHGLEHFDRQQLLDGARRGTERVSWKYRVWWGGLNIVLVERSLRLADRCVFLNDADREYSVERLGIARARTTVTHHGLPEYLRFLPLGDVEPADAGPRVVFLGTFNKRKGSDMAVAVLSGVLRRWATARVALVGTRAPAADVLNCFAPSLRSRIDVVPHFRNEQLPALLRGKHVLISPSRSEGFGKAILEGMACGLVPVATDIPGPHDILSQTGGGVLVPPGDADAMLAAVVNLVEDGDLLRRKRAVAHAASGGYSWDAAAAEREAVYLGAVRHVAAGDRTAPARS